MELAQAIFEANGGAEKYAEEIAAIQEEMIKEQMSDEL